MVTTKRTGPANLQPRGLAVAVAAAFLPLVAHGQTTSATLPTGFSNVVGGASVAVSGSTMNVNSASNAEINNWQTFSIGSSATVNFNQLGASSVSLNRVVGNNPSEIFGRLTANGQIFLVNNNGVLFARGSSVDVGGLFATSLSIADKDFLAGRYQFFNPGNAGAVINQGHIITANGFAALAGPQVRNDGVIIARAGSVALAAGDRVSLDIIGDGLISVSVDQAALNASAINTGRIEADGGMVLLTARSANALLDTVINNSGVIRANSLVERNGEIVLDGGSTGVVSVTGTLEAAGLTAGTTGGTIKVLGDKVGLFDGANLNTSGDAGGGTVLVGGNWQGKGPERNASATVMASNASISADAVTTGDGGTVVLWSDNSTKVHGTISARGGALSGNGGNVETSGHYLDTAGARVDTRAPKGKAGNWLLDPFDVTIVDDGAGTSTDGSFDAGDPNTWTPNATGSLVSDQDINDNLANTSVTITTVNANGTDAGDITVETDVSIVIPTNRTLTLHAESNILIQGAASFAGADPSSVLALNIGQAGGNGTLTISATATLPSPANGTINVTGHNGTDLIVVTRDANMSLSDSQLAVDGNYTLNLSSIEAANLTGGAGANTFTVANWTGTANLSGLASADVFNVTLSASGTVNVIGAGGTDTLNAIGNGSINVNATAVENGQVVTYGAEQVNVLGQGGNDTVTITATASSSNYSIDGGGGTNTIVVSADANFTLANALLQVDDGAVDFQTADIVLANVTVANLTGGASANTFDVTGWNGTGALDGGTGSDSVIVIKDLNFTLSDSALTSSDNMNLALAGIEVANLTGGANANTFTVANWTGTANLVGAALADVFDVTLSASGTVNVTGGGGSDTLNATGDGAINVNGTAVENGQVLTYATVEQVNVLGQGGSDTVTITATLGTANYSIDGGGGTNAVVVSTDANFTLANALLQVNGSGAFAQANVSLANVTVANLTAGASNNTFDVTGWNGTGALDGAGGTGDRIVAVNDVNFTLSSTALARSGQGTLTLANIEAANLTGGAANNTFTIGGWNGTGVFDGDANTGDRILATNDVNFTLTNTLLQRSGMTNQTLVNIEAANLTGGIGSNTFDVSAWTGLGGLNGGGSGTDTVVKNKDVNFTLTNSQLASSDGMTMCLTLINQANLTGGASANAFTVNSFQAVANLDGGGGDDTFNLTVSINNTYNVNGGANTDTVNVIGPSGADIFVISNTAVVRSGSNETVTYTGAENVVVQGAGGGDSFTFTSAAAGVNYSIQGGSSSADTLNITALNQNITLTPGTNDGTISGVGSFSTMETLIGANTLIGGPNWTITGNNSGTVNTGTATPFTFLNTGNVRGTGGNETFTMAGGSLTGSIDGGGGIDTLATSVGGYTFSITGPNSGTVSNGNATIWTGISNLTGGTGADSFTGVGGAVNITDVGGATTLANLQTSGALTTAGATTLNGTIQSGGNQTHSGAVTLVAAATVTSTGAAVNFGGTVNGAFALTANAATSANFNGSVNIGSLTVVAPAISLVGGVTTTGAQTYNGTASVAGTFTTNGAAFNVNGNTVLVGSTGVNSGAGPATFNGTVNGPGALTTNGATTFNNAIGNTSALAGLTMSGGLATFNTGTVNTTGAVALNGPVSAGAITFNTGGGSFTASNASNDFTGTTSVVTGSGGINLRDANNLILGPINAGAGSVTLNASSLQGAGVVTGGSGSITSLADISGMGLNMPGNMLVSGTGGVQTFSFTVAPGASQPGSYTQGGDVAVFINNALAFANSQHTNIGSVVGNAAQAAGAIIVEEANKTFGTDSVAEDIEYGFAGEIGATPPMDHRIDESGISLPRCVQEAREGLPCK